MPDVKVKILQCIVRGKVSSERIVMTDGWQSYDGLVDVGDNKHFRVKKYRKEGNPFTDGTIHVNGIKSCGVYTKRRFVRFNGGKIKFELHLKESAWRWGNDPDRIFATLIKLMD